MGFSNPEVDSSPPVISEIGGSQRVVISLSIVQLPCFEEKGTGHYTFNKGSYVLSILIRVILFGNIRKRTPNLWILRGVDH